MDDSYIYSIIEKISKKYNINYESLIKDCGLSKSESDSEDEGEDLEYINVNSKRYLYNHYTNKVYTCGKKQTVIGTLCKDTFQIILSKKD